MMYFHSLSSPVGTLTVKASDTAILGLNWEGGGTDETPLLLQAARQIEDYFEGQRAEFDLPLQVDGSAFQQAVCKAMVDIPFGYTRTYGEIAKQLGQSAQSVGQACGGNPIPIIIPCHRVMGANGKLTGFSGAGGVETKVALLRHEGAGGFLI